MAINHHQHNNDISVAMAKRRGSMVETIDAANLAQASAAAAAAAASGAGGATQE